MGFPAKSSKHQLALKFAGPILANVVLPSNTNILHAYKAMEKSCDLVGIIRVFRSVILLLSFASLKKVF